MQQLSFGLLHVPALELLPGVNTLGAAISHALHLLSKLYPQQLRRLACPCSSARNVLQSVIRGLERRLLEQLAALNHRRLLEFVTHLQV